jgi:acetylornithine deacetylase/succinyl-diaminopimelate desuccinylase-like protein
MSDWQRYLDDNQARFLDELFDYLRIPSVSSLPEHAGDVVRAAQWVADRCGAAGIENVEIMPTGGHPVVYGDWLHAPGAPTVLIYGHFDVQPADPFDLWTTPPFEPEIRNGRIYARGASDDKGNSLIPVLAAEALLKTTGRLPVNVKFLFEGQEEIGSPQVPSFMERHRERLSSDLVISADGGQYGEEQPGLYIAFKGLCAVQIDVTGPDRDLHSGLCGGAVQNPIHALAEILESMHGGDGRIIVDGFYDSVVPLSETDRRQIAEVPHDDGAYKRWVGVDELFGEAGYTTIERAWARPTLEVNGIWGGFQGEGVKTVLPSEAHAKVTCRLVPDQDPGLIVKAIARHVADHTPPGVRVSVTPIEGSAPPYFMPADHPGNKVAAEVLTELYGTAPYHVRSGGTLPICSHFRDILGVYSLNFAFALEDEDIHSPNEFFRLASFEKGQRAYVMLLEKLAERGL